MSELVVVLSHSSWVVVVLRRLASRFEDQLRLVLRVITCCRVVVVEVKTKRKELDAT